VYAGGYRDIASRC